GQYGITDTRNVGHGSDSIETAKREIEFFFPEFNIDQYQQWEKCYTQLNKLKFNYETLEHDCI
ncbi:unnamed protein product, partial [Didymodactylos carnosus]